MLVGLVILIVLGFIGGLVSPSDSKDNWVDRSGGHRH